MLIPKLGVEKINISFLTEGFESFPRHKILYTHPSRFVSPGYPFPSFACALLARRSMKLNSMLIPKLGVENSNISFLTEGFESFACLHNNPRAHLPTTPLYLLPTCH